MLLSRYSRTEGRAPHAGARTGIVEWGYAKIGKGYVPIFRVRFGGPRQLWRVADGRPLTKTVEAVRVEGKQWPAQVWEAFGPEVQELLQGMTDDEVRAAALEADKCINTKVGARPEPSSRLSDPAVRQAYKQGLRDEAQIAHLTNSVRGRRPARWSHPND